MARELKVEIIGDPSSLQRAFKSSADSSSHFGDTLHRVAKVAVLAAGAAGIGALALTLRTGISEFQEHSRVAAVTEAVLKSTGGTAGVTAKQVDTLAASLLQKSGVDDEAIQSGENLLLTFTNIRNEAGKGNDVFNQATKTTLDMSVALGKDMTSAAKLVGKALNDPIKGMSALTRVGVTFTDGQKQTIKSLVESGHAMDAQKIILDELNKKFGGSAEAVGKTLPGQLSILREQFNNFAGDLVAKALPALTAVITWATAHMPQFEAALSNAASKAGVAFDALRGPVTAVFNLLRDNQTTVIAIAAAVGTMVAAWEIYVAITKTVAAVQAVLNAVMLANPFVLVAVLIVGLVAAMVVLYQRSQTVRDIVNAAFRTIETVVTAVVTALRALWEAFGTHLVAVARVYFTVLAAVVRTYLEIVRAVINGVLSVIRGDWGSVWNSLKGVTTSALTGVADAVRGAAGMMYNAAKVVGKAIVDGHVAAVSLIIDAHKKIFNVLAATLGEFVSTASHLAYAIGSGIVGGIVGGLSGLASRVAHEIINQVLGGIDAAKHFFHIGSPSKFTMEELGIPLAQGIIAGIQSMHPQIASALAGFKVPSVRAPSGTGFGASQAGGVSSVGAGGGGVIVNHIHVHLDGKELFTQTQKQMIAYGRRNPTVLTGVGVRA